MDFDDADTGLFRKCDYCGGDGEIEVSFPVSCVAEEPDTRSMPCPECNDFDDSPYDDCDNANESALDAWFADHTDEG